MDIVQIPTLALLGFVVISFGKICEILLLKFMTEKSALCEDERMKLSYIYGIQTE